MLATVDQWWSSITISEKERIAGKIAKKEIRYPECTDVWNSVPDDRKEAIFEHCKGRHGASLTEWFDGEAYTD